MNGIARIRRILNQTQAEFAQSLSVSRSAVAMWEKGGQEPSFDIVKKLSATWNLPVDYILMIGAFREWDKTLTYYKAVIEEIKMRIPESLFVPFCSVDMTFSDWLQDTISAEKLDEFQTARWFSFVVRFIAIDENRISTQYFIDMEFTPEFKALIRKAEADMTNEPAPMTETGLDYQELEFIRIVRELDPAYKTWLLHLVETAVKTRPVS